MRVLFNTYPVAFDCPGGGEVLLLQSKAALERAGVEVLLFDPWRPQFDQVDLVHFYSVMGGSLAFCRYVKRRSLPLVLSPILWLTEENLSQMPMKEIGLMLQTCDRVLPNSKAEQEQLASQFDIEPAKFTITFCGIDATFCQPVGPELFRKRFGLDRPFLLDVGNIEHRKNQLRLIEATQGLGLPLVLVGRVRDRDYHDACLRASRDQVLYLGHLEHGSDLMKSAYEACELFVLPSLLETPGLAALEAAALGARITITAVGCAREYFGDLATYVDPRSVEDIRRGIREGLASPRDPRLGERIRGRFTWDHTARQLLEAYQRVALRGRGLKETVTYDGHGISSGPGPVPAGRALARPADPP